MKNSKSNNNNNNVPAQDNKAEKQTPPFKQLERSMRQPSKKMAT